MEAPDESWQSWFEANGPRLLLCARQWTRSVADAEDVLQEAFVRFWRHQRRLGGEPIALVLTSIRRTAVDFARRSSRREKRESAGSDAGAPGEPMFETPMEGEERRRAIEEAVSRLPLEQREVLVLKIWGGLTFGEIARQSGVSPNTVASRYRYALTALRADLNSAECHGERLPETRG